VKGSRIRKPVPPPIAEVLPDDDLFSDCSSGIEFSVPRSEVEKFVIPGSHFDIRLSVVSIIDLFYAYSTLRIVYRNCRKSVASIPIPGGRSLHTVKK